MSHRATTLVALFSIYVFSFGISLEPAQAQDAQAEATAKATKHQAAADTSRSTLDIATPTDVAPSRTGTTALPDAEKLKRRPGEQVGDTTRGRTLILGMQVKESEHGGVQVADVGAATPAFEAGIRKGDEIISFENFKADSYRKWIDGMRRLATGAPDAAMLTVVVKRDGNPVKTKIRVPENHVGPVQLPLGPPPQQQVPQPNGNAGNTVVANGGDSNVDIASNGPIASFFQDGQEPVSERAVAELFRVGPPDKVSGSGGNGEVNQAADAALPQQRGARVGFAGFRNDANGMLVMVDVGGLEPGNYSVGIGDPSAMGNQAQSIQSPTSNIPAPTNGGAAELATPQVPAAEAGSNSLTPNSNGAPLESPGAVSPPQSNSVPTTAETPRSVLAQVVSNPVSDIAGGAAPPTGQVQPLTAPAAGQADPTNTVPIGRSNAAGSPAPGQNELGTLTVDQSGTGRMQRVVEGVRVRNVVGQALVISASTKSPITTLPPNLDPTADPAPAKSPAARGATNPGSVASPPSSASPTGGPVPVVAGVIRLLSDRGGAQAGAAEGGGARPATTRQNGHAPNPAQPAPSR
jgi:PDZ domain